MTIETSTPAMTGTAPPFPLIRGHNPNAVIQLIGRRIDEGPFAGGEDRRLALIVEGGGMRGVLSAGSLFALDVLGCRNVFDDVYAASAGGVNAAYFLSGQGELGISVYFDDISSLRFANPLRFWKIFDVDYVYDHIVQIVKPLDEAAVRSSRSNLYLGVTDIRSGRNELVDVKASEHSIARILKASSAIPVLYNRTVALGEQRYVDGGLSDLLPIAQAAARGCTDILVLSTRLAGRVSRQPPLWERAIFYAMMGWVHHEVNRAYATNHDRTRQSRAYADGVDQLAGVNIATICPTPHELIVGRVTLSRATLLEGATRMGTRTASILGRPAGPVEHAFRRLEGVAK
jgi:predicted patatin/cPLA2 family phospholipase